MSAKIQTNRCQNLLRHWTELRGTDRLPRANAFLDGFDPALQPWLIMFDFPADGAVLVRLMGMSASQMWGADLTGINLKSVLNPERVETVYSDFRKLHHLPCGLMDETEIIGPRGDHHMTESVILPLETGPEKPLRIVMTSAYLSDLPFEFNAAKRVGIVKVHKRKWLDVGAGVLRDKTTGYAYDDWPIQLSREGKKTLR